jgi:hypothetical protein
MDRAFLYSGAVFLVMVSLLVAANYFILSKHTNEQSKISSLAVDAGSDIKGVLALDSNNVYSDAMSDAVFQAINSGKTLAGTCPLLQAGISQKINSYVQQAFSSIDNYLPNANLNYNINQITTTISACSSPVTIKQLVNITYNVFMDNPGVKMSYTLVHNKTLVLTDLGGYIYNINIIDENGRQDFYRGVSCPGGGACSPT